MLRFDAPRLVGPVPQAGRVVERVESRGKHLEIEWDDGLVLHTHMRMSGSWHLYHRGDAWRKGYNEMRASIEVEDWVAVCFNAPLVETYRSPGQEATPRHGGARPRSLSVGHRSQRHRQPLVVVSRWEREALGGDARPACHVWRGERVSQRGTVGHRTEPVCPRGGTLPSTTRSVSPIRRQRCSVPTSTARPGSLLPVPATGWPSTAATDNAVGVAVERSTAVGSASTRVSCTGARRARSISIPEARGPWTRRRWTRTRRR